MTEQELEKITVDILKMLDAFKKKLHQLLRDIGYKGLNKP